MTIETFPTFYHARDYAAVEIHGYPSWRVVPYMNGYAIELYPNGPLYEAGDGTKELAEHNAKMEQILK